MDSCSFDFEQLKSRGSHFNYGFCVKSHIFGIYDVN